MNWQLIVLLVFVMGTIIWIYHQSVKDILNDMEDKKYEVKPFPKTPETLDHAFKRVLEEKKFINLKKKQNDRVRKSKSS